MKSRVATAAVCTALFLTACNPNGGSASDNSSQGSSGLSVSTEVNVGTSSVTLPGDRFFLSEYETYLLGTAESIAMAKCARDELGINWGAFSMPLEEPDWSLMWYEFGPWTVDMAEQFAFAFPSSERGLIVNGVIPAPPGYEMEDPTLVARSELPQEDFDAVVSTCGKNPEVLQFNDVNLGLAGTPAESELRHTREALMRDDRAKEVFEELGACYEANGLEQKGDMSVEVAGMDADLINEEQVQLALTVVECKTEVNAIPRLASIWAELQAPTIHKYAAELTEYQRIKDDAISEARDYIIANPDLSPAR